MWRCSQSASGNKTTSDPLQKNVVLYSYGSFRVLVSQVETQEKKGRENGFGKILKIPSPTFGILPTATVPRERSL